MDATGEWKSEVGNFEFIKKLGEGGFGEVWLASDPKRGEKVAVKFLHLKHSDQNNVDVFKREFEILAELKQVHLARVFDFGFSAENEQYFLSTEFCPGKKLLEAIEGKSVGYFEEILVQLLSALECIHSQGVIHFDIKPENVLVEEVDGQPNVKLVDFGVAVRMKALPEQFGGTLAFIAPEVLQRSPKLDHRVDLYSLGMLSLFCLTKRLPFLPQDAQAVMEWHRSGSIPANLWKGKEIPQYLREITEKLLAKNPSERFSNSRVVLNFLNLATGGRYRQEEEELNAQIPLEGPIVERREEVLNPILRQMDRVLNGNDSEPLSSVCFITGETGIGKSRVLEEIRHAIQLKEITFFQVDCDWNIPSWPKLEAWLQIPQFSADALDQNWQTRRRMDAVLEAVQKKPLCLLIDDFHKADLDLKNLIFELAAKTRSLRETGQVVPLFILAAGDEEIEGGIRLPQLTPKGILTYLQLVLGERTPVENLGEVLHQYSGGLPLLMVEGLRYLAPHFFRGESLENLLSPAKIHQLYEEKIQKLKPEEGELLVILALLFRPTTEAELLSILKIPASQLLDLANPCFKAGLLSGNLFGDPVYRVSSQALALDLTGTVEPERRRGLHGRIAKGLREIAGIPMQELAYHLAKAGEASEAVTFYREAGNGLEKEGKITSACDCLRRAMNLLEAGTEDWQQITLKVFRLLVLSGNYRESEEYPAKLEKYPSWESEEITGWYFFKMRQFQKAREKYLAALNGLPADDCLHGVLIENALGNIDLQEGQIESAVSRFRKAFEREAELDAEAKAKINNNNLGLSLSLLGEHDQAIEFFETRLEHTPPNNIAQRLTLLNGIGYSCLQASRYEDTIGHLKKAMSLAEDSGALHALFSVMGNLLTALLKENRYVEALSICKKTVSYQRRFGTRRDVAHNLLRQGSVYLMLGMGEFAKECFAEGEKISREISETILTGWFLLMKAYWEREFGEMARSEQYFLETEAEGIQAKNEELQCWARYGLAEISYDQGKIDKCGRHLEAVHTQLQDHEFETRMRLLKAKLAAKSDPTEQFSELESQCLKNHYRELLWEVYQSWAQFALKQGAREAAIPLYDKGIQVIQGICATLPEEYQDRYRKSRARRKIFEERESAVAPKGGLFARFKKMF